jgi:hypothetical protein
MHFAERPILSRYTVALSAHSRHLVDKVAPVADKHNKCSGYSEDDVGSLLLQDHSLRPSRFRSRVGGPAFYGGGQRSSLWTDRGRK